MVVGASLTHELQKMKEREYDGLVYMNIIKISNERK